MRCRGTAHWTGDRSQSTLWNIPSREDRGHGHGTQKPVECMRRPMLNNSSPGQAVYEPFCGSGTTIIAAETIGRVCHAIEIEPAYVDVAVERWQAFTGKAAILEGGGRSFAEVAAERSAEKRSTARSRGRPSGGAMTTKAAILRADPAEVPRLLVLPAERGQGLPAHGLQPVALPPWKRSLSPVLHVGAQNRPSRGKKLSMMRWVPPVSATVDRRQSPNPPLPRGNSAEQEPNERRCFIDRCG